MWHKPCRTFHPWCLCIKTRCLYFLYSQPWWFSEFHEYPNALGTWDLFLRSINREGHIRLTRQYMMTMAQWTCNISHDNIIKWKHFPRYWPVVRGNHRSFDVFFDLRLNKRLSKQSRCRWFETSSRSIWRHCKVYLGSRVCVCGGTGGGGGGGGGGGPLTKGMNLAKPRMKLWKPRTTQHKHITNCKQKLALFVTHLYTLHTITHIGNGVVVVSL